MFAIIEDSEGREQARYILTDDDLLDCDIYAERFSNEIGYDLEPSSMPGNMCGAHYYVILQEEPGSVICWSSASYFLNGG